MNNKDMPAMPVSMETRQYEDNTGCTHVEAVEFYEGLTKREHFAGLAMQGLLSNISMIDGATESQIARIKYTSILVAESVLDELEKAK
jgi:hypothetical protein